MSTEPSNADYTHSVSAEKIAQLRSFREGERRVTEKAIDIARFLAVVPTGTGGIQIEWHAHGWDVEIEVNRDGEFDSVFATRAEAGA